MDNPRKLLLPILGVSTVFLHNLKILSDSEAIIVLLYLIIMAIMELLRAIKEK